MEDGGGADGDVVRRGVRADAEVAVEDAAPGRADPASEDLGPLAAGLGEQALLVFVILVLGFLFTEQSLLEILRRRKKFRRDRDGKGEKE